MWMVHVYKKWILKIHPITKKRNWFSETFNHTISAAKYNYWISFEFQTDIYICPVEIMQSRLTIGALYKTMDCVFIDNDKEMK